MLAGRPRVQRWQGGWLAVLALALLGRGSSWRGHVANHRSRASPLPQQIGGKVSEAVVVPSPSPVPAGAPAARSGGGNAAANATFTYWLPSCNYTVPQLRALVHAELLQELQLSPGTAASRAALFQDFHEAFADPAYHLHGFLMGTERTSPMRRLNQLLFGQLSNHSYSARALQHVDTHLGIPPPTGRERVDMSHCARATKSQQRADHLLSFNRLRAAPPPTTAPHVVFVVADDLGWSDVGVHSGDVFSPFVDAIHSQGVVLGNYYVDLVCSPSRASFQTGRFPTTTGAQRWFHRSDLISLPLDEFTLGDMFREAGYGTHYVGKWHLGYYCPEATPTFRGFDSFYGMYGGGGDYYRHVANSAYDQRRDFTRECGPGCSVLDYAADGTYSTRLFGEEAVRRVMVHDTDGDAPLFLMVSFQAVHGPSHSAPFQYASDCPARDAAWPGYMDGNMTAKQARRQQIRVVNRMRFTGVVTAMDQAIENLTAALEYKGMLHNTLLVFTTDNGAAVSGTDAWGASNFPLRGGKHTVWEGGTRGVAAVWGRPLLATPVFRPFESRNMMHGVDWFPTLRQLLDEWARPTSLRTQQLKLDGVGQLATLRSQTAAPQRSGFIYGHVHESCKKMSAEAADVETHIETQFGCGFAIRDGPWKLVYNWGGYDDTWTASPLLRSPEPLYHSKALQQWKNLCPDRYCLFHVVHDPKEQQEASFGTPFVTMFEAQAVREKLARRMRNIFLKTRNIMKLRQRHTYCVLPSRTNMYWKHSSTLVNDIRWPDLASLVPPAMQTADKAELLHLGKNSEKRVPFLLKEPDERTYWTYACAALWKPAGTSNSNTAKEFMVRLPKKAHRLRTDPGPWDGKEPPALTTRAPVLFNESNKPGGGKGKHKKGPRKHVEDDEGKGEEREDEVADTDGASQWIM